jgi:hypothetical protein
MRDHRKRLPLVPVGTIDVSPVIYARDRGSPNTFASRQGRLNEGRGNFERPWRDAEKGTGLLYPALEAPGYHQTSYRTCDLCRLRSGTEFRPSVDATILSRHSRACQHTACPDRIVGATMRNHCSFSPHISAKQEVCLVRQPG